MTIAPIKAGDTISVHYTGRFENGEVFDSSVGGNPLKFTVGAGQLIQGFDKAVVGLNQGGKITVTLPPEEAYGERNEELIFDMPRSGVPEGVELEEGQQIHLQDPQGRPVPATVYQILEDVIKVDVNSPMAGKTLIFDIEVAETNLTPDQHGHHHGDDHECGCGHDH